MLTNLFILSDSSGGTELLSLVGEIMIDYPIMVEVIAIFQSTLAFISVVVILIEL